ncbi:hypothetical protein KNT58_gp86 [Mycobacterium phage Fortunato]|uniref:Uncharacterized protein n=1 Tax=Mycobacterium phage Fortunato TaxID=1882439 RepID=A0A1D8EYH6_9CAUD|nr:hypothetical protein KNT58_gp86 [Mycobacterium phage Fortunato]AOT27294.1 hypothetical protein SEA_FORTUNATO_86 [Mycobacterium phage Fortunato]
MAGTAPKYPDVHVQLTGQDGNVFFIIGKVSKALREAGHVDQVTEFVNEVTDTDSYDAALAVVMQWVEVS